MDKIRCTLRQFVRDWSTEGESERTQVRDLPCEWSTEGGPRVDHASAPSLDLLRETSSTSGELADGRRGSAHSCHLRNPSSVDRLFLSCRSYFVVQIRQLSATGARKASQSARRFADYSGVVVRLELSDTQVCAP